MPQNQVPDVVLRQSPREAGWERGVGQVQPAIRRALQALALGLPSRGQGFSKGPSALVMGQGWWGRGEVGWVGRASGLALL